MVCGGDIFLSAIDIPATIFHFSMAVFLIYNIVKKSQHFYTGFYVLFAVISLFDVIQIGMIYIALRIPSCGYFPTLYLNNNWLAWLIFISTTYIEFYQIFGHTLISVNRFTVLVLSPKYNWIWTGKALCGWLFMNTILPLPLLAILFRGNTWGEAVYIQRSDGTFGLAPLEVDGTNYVSLIRKAHQNTHDSPCNSNYHFTLEQESISVDVFTTSTVIATLIAFVLELIVVIKIRHHLLSHKETSIPLRNDIKLLFSSIVVLCAQSLLILYHIALYSVFAQHLYILVSDVISLCGSFALFAISDTVRCKYLEFYRITAMLSKLPTRKRRTIKNTTLL